MKRTTGRVTLKDVATKAGVSVSTAHLVMAGKNGPKEETRQQVLRIADALHYQCNAAASSLKRGETRIGVVLPDLKGGNELYYTPIWAGVRAFCKTARDFNLHLVEMPLWRGGLGHSSAGERKTAAGNDGAVGGDSAGGYRGRGQKGAAQAERPRVSHRTGQRRSARGRAGVLRADGRLSDGTDDGGNPGQNDAAGKRDPGLCGGADDAGQQRGRPVVWRRICWNTHRSERYTKFTMAIAAGMPSGSMPS